jgi:hypothetical protein
MADFVVARSEIFFKIFLKRFLKNFWKLFGKYLENIFLPGKNFVNDENFSGKFSGIFLAWNIF